MLRHALFTAFMPHSWGAALERQFAGPAPKGLRWRFGFQGPRFTGLRAAIDSPLGADPKDARALYRGHYRFAGHDCWAAPETVFLLDPPDGTWMQCLHGFDWLMPLAAAGGQLYRAFARHLIAQWMAQQRILPKEALTAGMAARRAINLSRAAGFLTGHSRGVALDPVLQFASRLLHQLASARSLEAAIAAAYLNTAFRGAEALEPQINRRLAQRLDAEILPDGGPATRNPARLAGLLLDLVPLRQAMQRGRMAVPDGLHAAIERSLPMLRFFCHGDGSLAQFHGAGGLMKAEAKAVLDADTTPGRCLTHAPHSGYLRLNQGPALVIMDAGSGGACDSELAFEFSDGPHRIVVNCGHSAALPVKWIELANRTAAHSTADFGVLPGAGRNFWSFARPRPPGATAARSNVMHEGVLASAWTALANSIGHERSLFLACGGRDLRGEDSFAPPAGEGSEDATLRFHLHPSVRATLSQDGESVMLLLPNRQGWRFTARGGVLGLEDSIYLAGLASPRQTRQIVIHAKMTGAPKLQWAFKRIEKRAVAEPVGELDSPELPF